MCFFVMESSFTDQATIQYYHFCSNTEIQPRMKQKETWSLNWCCRNNTGEPYKTKNPQTKDFLWNSSVQIEE